MSSLYTQYKRFTPLIRWLVFVILACLTVTLILTLFKITPNALSAIKGLMSRPGDDSWKAMYEALELINSSPNLPVYDTLFGRNIKFQYPLSSLLLFDWLKAAGLTYMQIALFWDSISAICVVGLSVVSTRVLLKVLREKRFEELNFYTKSDDKLIYLLVLTLTFLFYPILRSFKLGQIQTILSLLTAITILCWQYDKKILVGIVLGFICVIKPQLGLLFVWGTLRKQWKMVLPGMMVIVAISLLSISIYGLNNNLDYLKVLSFLSHHGESFHANHSINGLLNRLLFNGSNLEWDGKFPDYNPVIYRITLASSMIFIFLGLFWNYKNPKPNAIELCIIILCTTMASPIAWEHHYAIIITMFIMLLPYMIIFFNDKSAHIFVLTFAYLMVSLHFESAKLFSHSVLNVLQSYLFFGSCIILYYLLSISNKLSSAAPE